MGVSDSVLSVGKLLSFQSRRSIYRIEALLFLFLVEYSSFNKSQAEKFSRPFSRGVCAIGGLFAAHLELFYLRRWPPRPKSKAGVKGDPRSHMISIGSSSPPLSIDETGGRGSGVEGR